MYRKSFVKRKKKKSLGELASVMIAYGYSQAIDIYRKLKNTIKIENKIQF